MVQSVQHGDGHKPTTHRLRLSQRGIRIRYSVQSLMDTAVVIPEIEFSESAPKMICIPNQHSVETLSAKRPNQTLDLCRCVGCAVRDRNRLTCRMPITCHSHTSNVDRHDILLHALSTLRGRPSWPNFPSLSWIRNLGCSSKQAFLTCCFVHHAKFSGRCGIKRLGWDGRSPLPKSGG
jgi:hypothetical protein